MNQGKFVYLSRDEMSLLSMCIGSWVEGVRAEIREKVFTGLAFEIAESGAQQLERIKTELDKFISGS